MDTGKIAIEHDHVIARQGHSSKGLAAVEGDVDGHPLASQHRRHRLGEPRMILHHQHPHPMLLSLAVDGADGRPVRAGDCELRMTNRA